MSEKKGKSNLASRWDEDDFGITIISQEGDVEKSSPMTFFDVIQKFNPYHDRLGRFSSAGGGAASFSSNPNTTAGRLAIERAGKDNPLVAQAFGMGRSMADEVKQNADGIRAQLSNEAKPIKAQPLNVDKVMKEAGVDRKTAERAGELSKQLFEKASRDEPGITSDVISATTSNGGSMFGLGARQKMETSMARKIASDAKEDHVSLEKAAAGVKGSVRYTSVFETDKLASGYNNIKSSLEEKGYSLVRTKNFFADYEAGKSDIKSIQSVFKSPNGTMFEFQFQTPQSQGAKEITHPFYEQSRAATTTPEQKNSLSRLMTQAFSSVPTTPEIQAIKTVKN